MPRSIIIDGELVLHDAHPDMTQALWEVIQANYAHLHPYLPWVDQVATLQQARQFLRETALFNQGGQKLILFIHLREKLIGSVGLMRIDHRQAQAEIGFWLGAAWEGQGLMSRALQALLEVAFTELALRRLEMRILPHNRRAIALAERQGFYREGTLRQAIQIDQQVHDVALYSLLADDPAAP